MTAPLSIETEGLSKDYRLGSEVIHALRDVSLQIERGAFVAVQGPSGSGKSTFMNLLGCLDRPTRGHLRVAGEDAGALSVDARAELRNAKIGFVFQQFNLLARTSARDNVEVPLIYAGVPAAERHRRAVARLEEMGLGDRLANHPNQLSGGQQQRVAIARALVNDPEILLADEPTGALDSRTGLEIMAIFQKLNRAGITVVVVTHEPAVARHARRLLSFRDGRLAGDEPNPEPADAAAELARLGPPEEEPAR